MRRIGFVILLLAFSFVVVGEKPATGKIKIKIKDKAEHADSGYGELAVFMFVVQLLRQNYVNEKRVTYKHLFQGALKGMLGSLDRFSSYQSPDEFKQLVNLNKGSFVGIGVVLSYRNNKLVVQRVEYNSPAFLRGIRAGDIILAVDGHPVKPKTLRRSLDRIKGKKGTKVRVKYFRPSSRSGKEVEITREVVEMQPIPDNGVRYVADGIGYIRVNQFSGNVIPELRTAMDRLGRDKLESLIIDLRGNPGGLLHAAVSFCSCFLESGRLVVKVEGRKSSENATYKAGGWDEPMVNIPLVVLIDHGSASASEIVAGCLRDYKRAILIGNRSYGKGSVQKIQRLNDGSGIKYTVALYYTPSHRVIHEKGIDPDVEVDPGVPVGRLRAQIMRYPGIITPDDNTAVTDLQLQRAVEILKSINLLESAGK